VVPRIVEAAPDAVLLVVTDPPDPLADLTRRLAGHDRVLSTGTLLDSLRFRVHLGRRLNVAPAQIEAQVLGEHGTSQIFHWSGTRVGGVPIIDALGQCGLEQDDIQPSIENEVRFAIDRFAFPDELELTRIEVPLASLPVMRERVSSVVAFSVLYGDRPRDSQPQFESLKVHISHLRKKFARMGLHVETLWGWGWKMPQADRDEAASPELPWNPPVLPKRSNGTKIPVPS
jgi:hypothetical protein